MYKFKGFIKKQANNMSTAPNNTYKDPNYHRTTIIKTFPTPFSVYSMPYDYRFSGNWILWN